jgi:6-phosphogluconolactonase
LTSSKIFKICRSSEELFTCAAETFCQTAHNSIATHGRFSVALSGGSTPKALYQLLATAPYCEQVDWSKVYFFWGDERTVPPDHPESNYRMAYEAMLHKLAIPDSQIFPMLADKPDVQSAATGYERALRSFFNLPPQQIPVFDLVLLGMGDDGHTASLFPHTAALFEQQNLVAANWVEKLNTYRLTLTVPVINQAHRIMFLVSGASKKPALTEVLHGEYNPSLYPSQLISPVEGELVWIVDREAMPQELPTSE